MKLIFAALSKHSAWAQNRAVPTWLANLASGLAILKEMKITDVTVLNPPLAAFPVFHYLHKKHEALVPKLHAVLLQMQKDKTIESIRKSVMTEQP